MEIKTITARIPTEFDRLVNEALSEGWVLVKRDVLQPWNTDEFPRLYYAEMEKRDTKVKEEAEVIERHGCRDCRYYRANIFWTPCPKCLDVAGTHPTEWEAAER